MRNDERDSLLELHSILTRFPLPHDGGGGKTASLEGYVGYCEDSRALVPFIQKVLMGMVTLSNIRKYPDVDYEEGWDYHDPKIVLVAIKKWLKLRNEQKWEKPDRYALDRIYQDVRREMGTEGSE